MYKFKWTPDTLYVPTFKLIPSLVCLLIIIIERLILLCWRHQTAKTCRKITTTKNCIVSSKKQDRILVQVGFSTSYASMYNILCKFDNETLYSFWLQWITLKRLDGTKTRHREKVFVNCKIALIRVLPFYEYFTVRFKLSNQRQEIDEIIIIKKKLGSGSGFLGH